jgi:hypothetical protein
VDLDLDPDAIVDRLAPESGEPPDVVALEGFLGTGPEGFVRLYCDPELKIFIDVAIGDVVHRYRIPEEQGAYGERSVIWVKGERMRTRLPQEVPTAVANEFLLGPFAIERLLPETLGEAVNYLTFVERKVTYKCPKLWTYIRYE